MVSVNDNGGFTVHEGVEERNQVSKSGFVREGLYDSVTFYLVEGIGDVDLNGYPVLVPLRDQSEALGEDRGASRYPYCYLMRPHGLSEVASLGTHYSCQDDPGVYAGGHS